VVAVGEGGIGLDTEISPVAAIPVGEHELAVFFFDGAMLAGEEDVTWEVEVAVFATDLQRGAARANGHADRAAFQDLVESEGARVLGRRVEERAVRIRAVGGLGRRVETE